MFRSMLTAAFLALSLIPAAADAVPSPRLLTLAGHGEVRVAPDMANVTIGVLSQADNAAAALSANTASMQAVFAALKGAGIAEKDMQTANFSVQPRYDYNNTSQPPRLVGYDVSNTVYVAVRQLDGLGAVLDSVIQAGSNQVNGIDFQVSKPEAALDEARKLAVMDAARKAKIYAAAGAVTLGPIQSISEGVYQPPMPKRPMAMRADAMAEVPIAQGEQVIAVDVSVAWEIK